MFELNETELKFLDAMGVEPKGVVFTDKSSGRIFLYADQCVDYTPDRYHYPLKGVLAYECGDDAIVFIREYNYTDKAISKELWKTTNVTRVLRNGIWHNLKIEKGTGNRCSISTEHLRPKEVAEPIKIPMVIPGKFPEYIYKTLFAKNDKNRYHYYLAEKDELSCGILSAGGFSLYISDHDALKCGGGRTVECNGETISVENETVSFSYENFVAIVKKYMGIGKWENKGKTLCFNFQIMCRVLIPSMLAQEIDEINKEIELKRRNYSSTSEEEKRLAILERIYEEFTNCDKVNKDDSDNDAKHSLRKHPGEVAQQK